MAAREDLEQLQAVVDEAHNEIMEWFFNAFEQAKNYRNELMARNDMTREQALKAMARGGYLEPEVVLRKMLWADTVFKAMGQLEEIVYKED